MDIGKLLITLVNAIMVSKCGTENVFQTVKNTKSLLQVEDAHVKRITINMMAKFVQDAHQDHGMIHTTINVSANGDSL